MARWVIDPADLPSGVEVYALAGKEPVAVTGSGRSMGAPDEFVSFIDDGQLAHYLIGGPDTAPGRPTNATAKLGVVRPRSSFTPHAHRGEHVVLSTGYASCRLWHQDRGEPAEVDLPPHTMIRIPAWLPHSFANRARSPLVILATNTGFGVDHDDYAVTAEVAAERGERPLPDGPGCYGALVEPLRRLEAPDAGASRLLGHRERAAAALRWLATWLERAS